MSKLSKTQNVAAYAAMILASILLAFWVPTLAEVPAKAPLNTIRHIVFALMLGTCFLGYKDILEIKIFAIIWFSLAAISFGFLSGGATPSWTY